MFDGDKWRVLADIRTEQAQARTGSPEPSYAAVGLGATAVLLAFVPIFGPFLSVSLALLAAGCSFAAMRPGKSAASRAFGVAGLVVAAVAAWLGIGLG